MNEATQTGVTMAVIGLVGTVSGLFFGWLKDREKYRFDVELNGLKSQNAQQATQIASLTRDHADCKEDHRRTEVRLAAIEQALAGKKDQTGEHKPLPG